MLRLLTPLEQVDYSPKYTLGSRTVLTNGNEYIYLPGTTSVAKYDWVSFNTAAGPFIDGSSGTSFSYGSVTRLAASGYGNKGHIAIAQAAIVGPTYGWFQIKGQGWGNCGDTLASGSPLYICTGTAATVTSTADAGQLIYGAFGCGTGASGGTAKVNIDYPYTLGQVLV